MLISEAYRDLNRELHSRGSFGHGGARWADAINKMAQVNGYETILDYGCGAGSLKQELEKQPVPFTVLEYDPAIEGKDGKPAKVDMVVCSDVLEHIEPDCLYAVLDDIHSIARKLVFLVIATRPAAKVLADGRNAHLIVERYEWWLNKLLNRWRMNAFKDLGGEFMFTGVPGVSE